MEPEKLNNPQGLEHAQNDGTEAPGNSSDSTEQKEQTGEALQPEVENLKDSDENMDSRQEDAAKTEMPEENDPAVQNETSDTEEVLPDSVESDVESGSDIPAESADDVAEQLTEAKKTDNAETELSVDTSEAAMSSEEEKPAPDEDIAAEASEQSAEENSSSGNEEVPAEAEGQEDPVAEEIPEQQEAEIEPEVKTAEEEFRETEQDVVKDDDKKDADEEKDGKKEPKVQEKKEKIDYSKLSQIELVNTLREVLDTNGDRDIKNEVEAIKAAFYRLVKEEEEESKKQFIEDGGEEDDFVAEDSPYEQDIKDLLKQYRQIRHEYNKKLEEEKEINLQLKYDIIEEIKGLVHTEESINKTFQDFRNLQQHWREIGLVPQAKMKDLWDTYHFHVENFYDYIKINKELRDIDLKKNLEIKIRLCEQAEELLLEPHVLKAFKQLQKLHDRWREVGPVPRENKDDIWERFKVSTTKINKKHQQYFEVRKEEQKKNLEAKQALCEQVEEINKLEITTPKEWGDKSKEIIKLQKVWKTIGFASPKDNNRIYRRFREGCDKFFTARRDFYAKNKELEQHNLEMKTELCMQAEALKDSEDWHKTTQDLINIQRQWKEIGPIPRKHSTALWKRFRSACDHFFEKKSEHFLNINSEQKDNLKEKEELIREVQNFKSTGDADENLSMLKDFQRRWAEIGHVPINQKDEIQKQFRVGIDRLFDTLKIDQSKRELLRFKSKMVSFSESPHGMNKMRMEREWHVNKLKQLENDLILLDNNIGFFTKSKNAEVLIQDVKRKIEQTKEKIESLKEKIQMIDSMDQSEE